MTRADLAWPYVEKVLLDVIGAERLEKVDDQVMVLRAGSSRVVIRMQADEPVRLQVFSPVLQGVDKSPALLERLNDIDAGLAFAKIFWVDGDVLIALELLADGLEKENIMGAINTIASSADALDDELRKEFGGETAFPDQGGTKPGDSRQAPKRAEGTGEGVGAPPGEEIGGVPTIAASPDVGDGDEDAVGDAKTDGPDAGYL